MSDAVESISRASGQRLAQAMGGEIVVEIEEALRDIKPTRSDRYVDPIALGGLIVSMAALAWTIIEDLRQRGDELKREVIVRRLLSEVEVKQSLPQSERTVVIDVIADEALRAAYGDDDDLGSDSGSGSRPSPRNTAPGDPP
jgi:hypothetical protein